MPIVLKHKRDQSTEHKVIKRVEKHLSNDFTSYEVTLLRSKMLFVSGSSPHLSLTHRVYDFFTERYEMSADVEVFHTNLRDENARRIYGG